MEEYIVNRSIKNNVKQLLLALLGDAIILLFILSPKDGESGALITVGMVLSYIAAPILIITTIFAVKDLKNTNPYLVISEAGLIQNLTKYQSGLILWEDIEAFKLRAVIGEGTYMISVLLRNPEKYIKDKKLLARLRARREKNPNEGEITLVTNAFKKEAKEAVTYMLKCWGAVNQNKENAEKANNILKQ